MQIYCSRREYNFLDSILFYFVYKIFAVTVTILKGRFSHECWYLSENKQFSLQFFFSLLQVYIVYRVSFVFRLNAFLESVCTKDSLTCFADRGEGEQDWYVRRDFRFINFTTFCYLIFVFFWKTFFFFTNDIYPRPVPTTHDPQHLATLGNQ